MAACGVPDTKTSQTKAIKKNNQSLVYVDTHDSYRAAFNPLKPNLPISQSNMRNFSRYFENRQKAIALTFDCSWVEEENGMEILDFLRDNNIKATFFIAGHFVFENPGQGNYNVKRNNIPMVRRMVEDGHEFGNHSTTHKSFLDFPNTVDFELRKVKEGWDQIVKAAFPNGDIPANAPMTKFWRAPYGEYNSTILEAASRAGYPFHFGWNVDVRDTTGLPHCQETGLTGRNYDFDQAMRGPQRCESPRKMTDLIRKFLDANRSHIETGLATNFVVLAHLSNKYRWGLDQVHGLTKLHVELQSRGFLMVPIGDIFDPRFFDGIPDTEPPSDPELGRACVVGPGGARLWPQAAYKNAIITLPASYRFQTVAEAGEFVEMNHEVYGRTFIAAQSVQCL